MSLVRFIHAADLHLDSQIKGLSTKVPEEHLTLLRDSTFKAYENIVDLCMKEKVDALLVAGDVYDRTDRSFKAQYRFTEGLKKLSDEGVRSFICHGNHDPLDGWQNSLDYPELSYQFRGEAESVPVFEKFPDKVKIHGISYPTGEVRENLIPKFLELEKGQFNIGLIHANVGGNPYHGSYAPCNLSDLEKTGFDYWALGHVHTRNILKDRNPTVVYPGNPQSRHVNERGPRGVFLVDVDEDGKINCEFRAVDIVRWEVAEIRADELETQQNLIDTLEEAFDRFLENSEDRPLLIRATLTGPSPIHSDLIRTGFIEDVCYELNDKYSRRNQFLWCERIDVATSPQFDRTERSQGTDFIADLLKLKDTVIQDDSLLDEFVEEVSQIYTKGKVGSYSEPIPSRDQIREILAEAEALYISKLEEGGS